DEQRHAKALPQDIAVEAAQAEAIEAGELRDQRGHGRRIIGPAARPGHSIAPPVGAPALLVLLPCLSAALTWRQSLASIGPRQSVSAKEPPMDIRFAEFSLPQSGAVVVGVWEDRALTAPARRLDEATQGAVARAVAAAGRFHGK